jgi:DNA-binding transcriptional MerR regulator
MKEFEVTSFIEFYSRRGYNIKEIRAVVDMWNKSRYRSPMFLHYFGLDEIEMPITIDGNKR